MGKVKWGNVGGDQEALTADDINSAETGYKPFDGPTPAPGVYRMRISLKQQTSSNGNPMINVMGVLVPRGDRKGENKMKGFTAWGRIPVMKSTAFRVRPLLEALKVSATDFLSKTMTDEEGRITRIGKLNLADGVEVLAELRMGKPYTNSETGETRPAQLELNTFLPLNEDDDSDGDDSDEGDDDGDGEEPPF